MRKIKLLIVMLMIGISSHTSAQNAGEAELKPEADSMQYLRDIEAYVAVSGDLSAQSLFFVARICSGNDDYLNALRFLDLSLQKDSVAPATYLEKGDCYYHMQQYTEAMAYYRIFNRLKPERSGYHERLGNCWYAMKDIDKAMLEYDTAIALAGENYLNTETYSKRGLVYTQRKEFDKALEAWYLVKLMTAKGTEEHSTALYNIWQLQWKKGSYAPAESALNNLLLLCHSSKECPVDDCYDYYACARVIQIYYQQKEYDKAKPFKDKMYEAHRKGYRYGYLSEMFCFDRFEWRDKVVEAWERYEENDTTVYAKHIFFLKNQGGEEEFRIQSVYSPGTDWRRGDQYVMCMLREQSHSTFDIRFKRDVRYEDMKKAVIDILEGKAKPITNSSDMK